MSISGNLEDVSVTDVLQFVHLGRSTGTLVLTRDETRAEITFHRGRIINAWTPESKRLGELLVAQGLLTQEALEGALMLQNRVRPRRPLGKVLTATNVLSIHQIHKAVARQIEETVFKIMLWNDGEFEFSLDQLKPIDELGMYPGDVLANLRLNTEQLLLRGAQMWDEGGEVNGHEADVRDLMGRRFEASTDRDPNHAFTLGDAAEFADAVLEKSPLNGHGPQETAVRPRLQLLTPDSSLVGRLREFMPNENGHLGLVEPRDAGSALPGEPSPMVVVDLRPQGFDLEMVRTLRRVRPRATVVAMINDVMMTTRSYEAGAAAVVPEDPQALASCLETLLRDRGFSTFRDEVVEEARASFNKLRRIVADLRSGVLSATRALNLMHILSESVERAVLFLARRDALTTLGAFGTGLDGRPLAELCSDLQLSMAEETALTEAVAGGHVRSMSFGEAALPAGLEERIGRPAFDQVVILPVMGTERVIAVIYADNGDAHRPIEEIDMLELAAAQVGIAFENEILRRKLNA